MVEFKRLEEPGMSSVSRRMRDKSDRPLPRPKGARLSPELDEVLRMLKALEDQPDAGQADAGKSR